MGDYGIFDGIFVLLFDFIEVIEFFFEFYEICVVWEEFGFLGVGVEFENNFEFVGVVEFLDVFGFFVISEGCVIVWFFVIFFESVRWGYDGD